MAIIDTPRTRRRQDRRLVLLLALAFGLLMAETFLRINGLLPPLVGEAMFALGVTAGVVGTVLLAWTAPAAAADAASGTATADAAADANAGTSDAEEALPRRTRRAPLARRAVLDL